MDVQKIEIPESIANAKEITEGTLSDALRWAFEMSLVGKGPLDSYEELAERYKWTHDNRWKDAGSLISGESARVAGRGFVLGLGGAPTIPATVAAALLAQFRMTAAIAYLGEYEVDDDRVRVLCMVCTCGAKANQIIKEIGIEAGEKLLIAAATHFSGNTAARLTAKAFPEVSKRLLATYGSRSLVNFAKFVPLVSGGVTAIVDGTFTKLTGEAARRAFIGKDGSMMY